MSPEETCELNLKIQTSDESETTPMIVEIRVKEGIIASISGRSDGKKYEGTLVLKPISDTVSEKLSDEKESTTGATGLTDEGCIVCDPRCHFVSPCPLQPTGQL